MTDLIFVVRNDGTFEQVPNRNLRAQENYSDNFVVIANRVGVVKAKIKLLSRTDRVEVKYLVPSLESVESLIGDKPYFQDYAQANVWRGAVPKKLLQEISMSYAGQVEVSFSFTNSVLDSRALVKLGELSEGDLPESAENGEYYIIRYASYTKNDITWTYGQQAIWEGEWIKGGTYQVVGTTTTHKLYVEQTLVGEQAEFDTENEDEYLIQLGEHAQAISELEIDVDDHELRVSTNESDIVNLEQEIDDIKDGTTIAKKAEQDSSGRVIEDTYFSNVLLNYDKNTNEIELELYTPTNELKAQIIELEVATQSLAGLMSAADKARVDELWEVLQNSDDPTFIDTIRELLDIFENYPEGLDIVAEFATKVDKTQKINNKALSGDITLTSTDIEHNDTDVGTELDRLESVKALKTDLEASKIDYDNSTSGLTATDTQSAIDETKNITDTKTDQTYTDAQLLLKQDKIVDTGWLQLTVPSNWKDGQAFVRKIQGVIYLRMQLQFPDNDNDWSGATYNSLGSILPVGYRPLAPFSITHSTSSNVNINAGINIAGASVSVISSLVEIFANRSEEKNRWIGVNVSYMVN